MSEGYGPARTACSASVGSSRQTCAPTATVNCGASSTNTDVVPQIAVAWAAVVAISALQQMVAGYRFLR